MKSFGIIILLVVLIGSVATARPVVAQTPTPVPTQTPAPAPAGQVSGKIINQNQSAPVAESLDIMLHIWDQDNNAINMLHAKSAADGTFLFTGVDLQPQHVYGVMATFDGVTYLSQVVPPTSGSNSLQLDVPVYETTQETSGIQIDQMHVLFQFAADGLETTEIFALSNTGKRTVKDAIKLDDGKTATLRYPLPAGADYIFFQPEEGDRFVKFPGGFADTSPFLPGGQGDQYAVQYMVPYAQQTAFDFTTPVNIKAINFLLPQGSGVALKGDGLAGPESVTYGEGKSYEVYTRNGLQAGQSIHVTLSGRPAGDGKSTTTNDLRLPLALGGGLLGLAMIGAAVWWWRRPEPDEENESGGEPGGAPLDALLAEIAELDAAHERGELEDGQYQRQRKHLRNEAKQLLDDSRNV